MYVGDIRYKQPVVPKGPPPRKHAVLQTVQLTEAAARPPEPALPEPTKPSTKIGMLTGKQRKYLSWVAYVGIVCGCGPPTGGIGGLSILRPRENCRLAERFALGSYFFDGRTILQVVDRQRAVGITVDPVQGVVSRKVDKKDAHDDLYMAMTNTLLWLDAFHRYYHPAATQQHYLQQLREANQQERRTLLRQHEVLDGARQVEEVVALRPIWLAMNEQREEEQGVRQEYQFQYGVERVNRRRPVPARELHRTLLEAMRYETDAAQRAFLQRYTTPIHTLTFRHSETGQYWMPLRLPRRKRVNEQEEDGGGCTLRVDVLPLLERVLHMALRIHEEFGALHGTWSRAGTSNVFGLILKQTMQHCTEIRDCVLPAPVTTLPATPVAAATTMPPTTHRLSLTRYNRLFLLYFRVLAYERFVQEMYARHRSSLLGLLLDDEHAAHHPTSPPQFAIRAVVRQSKRTSYQDALRAYLGTTDDQRCYDVLDSLRASGARTPVYTPTMLS